MKEGHPVQEKQLTPRCTFFVVTVSDEYIAGWNSAAKANHSIYWVNYPKTIAMNLATAFF